MSVSKRVVDAFNILVLVCSIFLVIVVSMESLSKDVPFSSSSYMAIQLFICIVYMIDFFVRMDATPKGKKWNFLFRNIIFLLVSIPYLNIIYWSGVEMSPIWHFSLKVIPLIRGAFGLSLVIRCFTKSRVSNLFYTYVFMVISFTYLSAIALYITEGSVNPNVKNFWDAIWWASMNVTTVGASFFPIYPVGQTLAFTLAGCGMVLFPIFTAFVTTRYQNDNKRDLNK